MGIKEEIDKLNEADLFPEAPAAGTPTKPADPAAADILAVVERLTKPWKYGIHYQRFAKDTGVPLEQVKEIADEVARRKSELQQEVGEIEP